MDDPNWFGKTQIPILGIRVEQLILVLYPTLIILVFFPWLRSIKRNRSQRLVPHGYHKLGIQTPSNIGDEYDTKYAIEPSSQKTKKWRVKALYIHPIKSCKGVELDVADIDAAGMLWDRKFAFAEWMTAPAQANKPSPSPGWMFRTLRQPGYERLTLVKPEIWLKERDGKPDITGEDGIMVVRYPYVPSGLLGFLDRIMMNAGLLSGESCFSVPLVPPRHHTYRLEEVTVWKDLSKWLNFSKHLPDEFKQYVGVTNPLTLFRVDPNTYREVHRCAPKKQDVGYQPVVGFADAYPLHLMNLASVRDINARTKTAKRRLEDLSVRRFRPNFIVTGGASYDEDDWKRVRIGEHELFCVCHTIRCRLPNVDPDTAERHADEPDKTLKSFRCIDPGDKFNAALGMMLVPATDQVIQVRVGDEIEVLERGEHYYLKQ